MNCSYQTYKLPQNKNQYKSQPIYHFTWKIEYVNFKNQKKWNLSDIVAFLGGIYKNGSLGGDTPSTQKRGFPALLRDKSETR